jgi:aconitate hydratase
LGLTGYETFEILGLDNDLKQGQNYTVRATTDEGKRIEFEVVSRIDTPVEANYYKNGGILQTVLRRLAQQ